MNSYENSNCIPVYKVKKMISRLKNRDGNHRHKQIVFCSKNNSELMLLLPSSQVSDDLTSARMGFPFLFHPVLQGNISTQAKSYIACIHSFIYLFIFTLCKTLVI